MSPSRPGSRLAPRPGRRLRRRRPDPLPQIIAALLCVCLALVIIAVCAVLWRFAARWGRAAAPGGPVSEETGGIVSAAPSPAPTPTALQPAPAAEPSASQPLEVSPTEQSVDSDAWFSDAVFIGDSRTEGLRLYSGITSDATFLSHTGLSIYKVERGDAVLRRGDRRVSVLDALAQGSYGKVYLSVGVNELGYFNPSGYAATYGRVIDAVRACQPGARVYVQLIIPVNTARCSASGTPYYITNEAVANYNAALAELCAEKDVTLLGIPQGLLDEAGELDPGLTTDGVHFKVEGYAMWLDYLLAHTEG